MQHLNKYSNGEKNQTEEPTISLGNNEKKKKKDNKLHFTIYGRETLWYTLLIKLYLKKKIEMLIVSTKPNKRRMNNSQWT